MSKHQIDFTPAEHRVEVLVNDVKIAATTNAVAVSETALPTRYYIPTTDVEQQYLIVVDTQSHCPYKGDASYYNVVVDGQVYVDTAWSYPDPIAEAKLLKDTIAFWPEKNKRIQLLVDGTAVN